MSSPAEGDFRYPRRRLVFSVMGQDVLLVTVLVVLGVFHPPGLFAKLLALGIVVVLLWGAVTLHFPHRIVMTDRHIAFSAYGRAHRFSWDEVRACRVRRFLVRDRVLVRILPAPPFRGRYWILDSLENFEALVAALEARSPGHTES